MKKIVLLFVISVLWLWTGTSHAADWDLALLITSNLNGQLEPFTIPVYKDGEKTNKKVGGAARLIWTIKSARKKFPGKTILVSAGDDFAGPFFVYDKGRAIAAFMNMAGFDAAALGNREFDFGDAVLAETIGMCRFPYVASNLDFDEGSPVQDLVHKYRIIERNGLRIGVFGLLGKEVLLVSSPGPGVRIDPDYESTCRDAIRYLRDEQDVDLTLGLFHISGTEARDLATRIPGIDVICVGKTNVVTEQGRELVLGPDGSRTLVIEPEVRGRYLGLLKLEIKNKKTVRHYWGPIQVEASFPEDTEASAMIAEAVERLPSEVTLARLTEPVDLRKPALRTMENAFADAICDLLKKRYNTDAVLLNGGGIRGDKQVTPGLLTTSDLEEIFPFRNTITLLTLTGEALKSALELGVSDLPEQHGRFLQTAGIRYEIDLDARPMKLVLDAEGKAVGAAEPGARIKAVEVMGPDGSYYPLILEMTYSLVTSSFIAQGGDGFYMLRNVEDRLDTGLDIKDVVEALLKTEKTISPRLDGRIKYKGRP